MNKSGSNMKLTVIEWFCIGLIIIFSGMFIWDSIKAWFEK